MKQDDFYKEIVGIIHRNADIHNPDKLAFAVYGCMKQNPDVVKMDKTWGDMLRNMKIMLCKHFSWNMKEFHSFLVQLNKLSCYMKKST